MYTVSELCAKAAAIQETLVFIGFLTGSARNERSIVEECSLVRSFLPGDVLTWEGTFSMLKEELTAETQRKIELVLNGHCI